MTGNYNSDLREVQMLGFIHLGILFKSLVSIQNKTSKKTILQVSTLLFDPQGEGLLERDTI